MTPALRERTSWTPIVVEVLSLALCKVRGAFAETLGIREKEEEEKRRPEFGVRGGAVSTNAEAVYGGGFVPHSGRHPTSATASCATFRPREKQIRQTLHIRLTFWRDSSGAPRRGGIELFSERLRMTWAARFIVGASPPRPRSEVMGGRGVRGGNRPKNRRQELGILGQVGIWRHWSFCFVRLSPAGIIFNTLNCRELHFECPIVRWLSHVRANQVVETLRAQFSTFRSIPFLRPGCTTTPKGWGTLVQYFYRHILIHATRVPSHHIPGSRSTMTRTCVSLPKPQFLTSARLLESEQSS
jgi:hypothetical protein